MPKVGQPSFTSGELDPALHARADLQLYRTGLATCSNYIVQPQGGVRNRPGTKYVAATKSNAEARLMPFAYNDDDSYLLEFTANAMRVYRNGSQVALPSTPTAWADVTAYAIGDHVSESGTNYYCIQAHTSAAANDQPGSGTNWTDYWHALESDIVEIPTPWTYAQTKALDFEQNADTLIITHSGADPVKLIRTDHHQWKLETLTYAPQISAPTGLSATGGTGTAYNYVVTAVDSESFEESVASASVSNNEDGGKITWTDVSGASKYNIYKQEQGIYGFIGQSSDGTTGFTDSKLIALTDDTPPVATDPFASTTAFPNAVAFHEQRLCFGGADPQRVNTSQTGNYFNFSVSEPANDGDALTLDIVTNKIAQIRYIVSQIDLLVFTAGAEVRVTSGDNAFTLDNLRRKTQSQYGCEQYIKPQLVGDKILFVQRGGKNIRDFAFSWERDKFTGGDLSVIAKHLYADNKIIGWAFQEEPNPIMWMVMNNGALTALTIAEEHQVLAFHQHSLGGDGAHKVLDVEVVPESDGAATYFVVERTINSGTKRYIERLSEWQHATIDDATFSDCHLTGTITGSSISGLDHLEGEDVVILIGGDVVTGQTVTSGAVTLPRTYTNEKACVGYGYTSQLKTLEPPINDAYGNEMSVARLQLKVLDTRGVWAGPTADEMTEYPTRDTEDWGEPGTTHTGTIEIVIEPTWKRRGQVVVEQRDPLPSYILAMVPEVEVGG